MVRTGSPAALTVILYEYIYCLNRLVEGSSMAKKIKRKKIEVDPKMSAILWQRLQEGGFILLSAFSLFLLVALCTYTINDPGWSHTAQQKMILNSAGRTGAWFSDLFLYLFGYIAYMFPIVIGYGGFKTFQNRFEIGQFHRLLWMLRVLGFTVALLAGCGLTSLHFALIAKGLPLSAGGILGEIVASELLPAIGQMGTTLLLLAFFLAGITLTTGLSWFGLMDIVGRISLRGFLKCQENVPRLWALVKDRIRRKKTENVPTEIVVIPAKNSRSKRIQPSLFNGNAPNAAREDEIEINPIEQNIDKKMKTPALIALPRPAMPKPIKLKDSKPDASSYSKSKDAKGDIVELPSVSLLEEHQESDTAESFSVERLESMSREVEARLAEFGVVVTVVGVYPGPVITRFELELAAGLKASKITGLAKDLARALLVTRVRVVEVIPGKSVVGIEIPNENREIVRLREMLESSEYAESNSPLSLALGKDIGGHPIIVNLAKMPHLLVAGTTGSGKSVGVNAMLLSLLYKATPSDVRLILIDPKMLELSIYDGIPHLLTPVITDMKDAANGLRWCVAEMERRYKLMAAVGVRNLVGYNRKVEDAERDGKPLMDPLWQSDSCTEQAQLSRLPYIVVIIDEFADMIMVVGKKVEELIARIAQKARAAGIHLILATQRPSVDVITGLIKANVPTRIAFQVSSRIDSRTILDQQGAEQLLGHGDMLYLAPGTGIPIRVHGAFVSDEEVHAVVKAWKQLGEPDYEHDILGTSGSGGFGGGFGSEEDGEQDDLYDEAVKIVLESRRASISNLQRRLKIGYNRAARLIETMEAAGLVSSMQNNGSRDVMVAAGD